MTSAENIVLEPPNFGGEDTPRPPLQGSLVPLALAIMPSPPSPDPVTKNLATALTP